MRGSSRQPVGRAPSSIIFSQRALDRVAWAEHGRRDRWDRAHCRGSPSRVRYAIFGRPPSATRGDRVSSVISQRIRAGWVILFRAIRMRTSTISSSGGNCHPERGAAKSKDPAALPKGASQFLPPSHKATAWRATALGMRRSAKHDLTRPLPHCDANTSTEKD